MNNNLEIIESSILQKFSKLSANGKTEVLRIFKEELARISVYIELTHDEEQRKLECRLNSVHSFGEWEEHITEPSHIDAPYDYIETGSYDHFTQNNTTLKKKIRWIRRCTVCGEIDYAYDCPLEQKYNFTNFMQNKMEEEGVAVNPELIVTLKLIKD